MIKGNGDFTTTAGPLIFTIRQPGEPRVWIKIVIAAVVKSGEGIIQVGY